MKRTNPFQELEGHQVSLALADGTRIDDGQLVSAGRHAVGSVWVFSNGIDMLIPQTEILDLWEVGAGRAAA